MSKIDKTSAIYPPDWELADAKAIQMLASGEASAAQQKRALNWIIHTACATYDLPFRPGAEGGRETDLAIGRMFVGQQIVKMTKIDLVALQKKQGKEPKE